MCLVRGIHWNDGDVPHGSEFTTVVDVFVLKTEKVPDETSVWSKNSVVWWVNGSKLTYHLVSVTSVAEYMLSLSHCCQWFSSFGLPEHFQWGKDGDNDFSMCHP